MAIRVFCNSCFCEPRKASPRFIFTSCGHVICELCLQKGKKDECLICRTPCRTVFLSKETSPEIQSLFMGIDTLCKKYSKEITQIAEFQEKNRKHLLAYQREKRVKLEESLRKARQQLHQIQCMKPPQQATQQLPFASTSRNPLSMPSRRLNGCSSYSHQPGHPSTSEIMESMEVDPVPSPVRKPETMTGPVRLSVITPPQDGRMGSVSYRSSQSSGITSSQSTAVSTRSTPIGLPHNGCSLISPSGSQSSRRGSWSATDFRTPPLYQFTLPSPRSSVTRPPITISGILQRQHLGSASFGGQTAER